MSGETNKYFCILPWIHLEIQQGGHCTSCCKTQYKVDLGNIKNHSPFEIANHPLQKELRKAMAEGIPSSVCRDCYADEEVGLVSLRQRSNLTYKEHFPLIDQITLEDYSLSDFQMRYVGLRFSNLCNLSCVYCSSYYSTSVKDHLNYGHTKTFDSAADLEKFIDNECSKVQVFYIAGGEPLLDPLHSHFLEYLVKTNRLDVNLIYDTNLSIPFKNKMEIIDNWKKFKSVGISASLDAEGESGETIRTGLKWETALENIKLIRQHLGPGQIRIRPTITCLNVKLICNYIRYLFANDLVTPENIVFNFLESPVKFNVNQLSTPELEVILRDIDALKLELMGNQDIKTIYPVIKQLNSLASKIKNDLAEKI